MPESNIPNSPPPDPRWRVEVVDHTGQLADCSAVVLAVQSVLKGAGIPRGDVSVAIVDDPTIQRINRDHLQHDWPTDVVTFESDDPLDPSGGFSSGIRDARAEQSGEGGGEAPAPVFGEIILSLDTARRVAAELQLDMMGEVLLYAIHGTLHLVGYDDHSPSDRLEMRAAEKRHLAAAGHSWRELPVEAAEE